MESSKEREVRFISVITVIHPHLCAISDSHVNLINYKLSRLAKFSIVVIERNCESG